MAAVPTNAEGRPRKVKLAPVKGFRKREIARGARAILPARAAGGLRSPVGRHDVFRKYELIPD